MFHLGDFSSTIPEIGLETYFSTVSAWSPLMLYSLYSIRRHLPLSFHLSLECVIVLVYQFIFGEHFSLEMV